MKPGITRVERRAGVEVLLHRRNEVGDGVGRLVLEERHDALALAGGELHPRLVAPVSFETSR